MCVFVLVSMCVQVHVCVLVCSRTLVRMHVFEVDVCEYMCDHVCARACACACACVRGAWGGTEHISEVERTKWISNSISVFETNL